MASRLISQASKLNVFFEAALAVVLRKLNARLYSISIAAEHKDK